MTVSAHRLIADLRKKHREAGEAAAGTLAHLRVNPKELEVLISELRRYGRLPSKLASFECAALVLVAGRILCEDDVGRVYSWNTVWERLEWGQPLMTKLYQHIETGFTFWGLKRPHRFGRQTAYLASVILASGLPVEWLEKPEHAVGRLVRRLLALAGKLEVQPSAIELGEGEALGLKCLQNSDAKELCVLLADELWSLRQRLPAGIATPSEAAMTLGETWRDSFPIQWSSPKDFDQVIDSLLAIAESGGTSLAWLAAASFLSEIDGTLERRIGLVAQRTSEDLIPPEVKKRIPPDASEVSVSVVEESGARSLLGRIELRSFGCAVVPVRDAVVIRGLGAATITFATRGETLGAFIPPGAEAIDEDAPWVFVAEENKNRPGLHRLIGVGDVSTSRNRVWLSCLEESPPTPGPGGSATPVPMSAKNDRSIWELSGTAVVESLDDDDQFTVRTGATDEEGCQLAVRGRTWWASGSRRPIWLGAPHFDRVGHLKRVPISPVDLEWRPRSAKTGWRQWTGTPPLGTITVRTKTPEGQFLRTTLAVLPIDFEVGDGGEEALRVTGTHITRVSTETQKSVRQDDGAHLIRYEKERVERAELPVEVHFGSGSSLTVELPLPTAPYGFVDTDGDWLPPDTALSVPRLEGVKAMVKGRGAFDLVLRSSLSTDARGWEVLIERRSAQEAMQAIFLDEIVPMVRARLRSLRNLDARVDLEIRPLGEGLRRSRLSVGHYGFALGQTDGTHGPVIRAEPAGRVDALRDEVEELELFGFPLANPSQPPVRWSPVTGGMWSDPKDSLVPGPWFVYAESRGLVRSRPKRVVRNEDPRLSSQRPSDDNVDWTKAVCSADSGDARRGAWDDLLQAMSKDPTHPSWKQLIDTLRHAERLPAVAFDALLRLAECPDGIALLLLNQGSEGILQRHVSVLAEVSVLPAMVPLQSWGRAFRALGKHATSISTGSRAFATASEAFFQLARAHYPDVDNQAFVEPTDFVRVIAKLAADCMPGFPRSPDPEMPRQLLATLLNDQRREEDRELLRRKASEEQLWPVLTFGLEGEELANLYAGAEGVPGHTRSVLRAPDILARVTFLGDGLTASVRGDVIAARTFAPRWFDEVHRLAFAHLVLTQRELAERILKDD